MSETPSGGGAAAPGAAEAWDEIEFPIARVRELFVTLGKALRAVQLYDENNPVYQRFVQALADAFRELWAEVDVLPVAVEEERLLVGGEEVHRAEKRGDSLAFLFYKDGVRRLTFRPGIEGDELIRFLGVLQRARNLRPEGDDLLTILWEEDFQFFEYQYVDMLAEGVSLPEAGPPETRGDPAQALEELKEEIEESAEAAAGEGAPPPQTVNQDDFNPTLYSLDPREKEQIRLEVEREMRRDLRADVLSALFDRLEEPERPERQSQILRVLRTLLPNLLSRGAIGPTAGVVEELERLRHTPGMFDAERSAEVDAILEALSSAETIEELVRALRDGTVRAAPEVLGRLLRHLRGGALGILLRASETVDDAPTQETLRQAVQSIAQQNPDAVLALLENADPLVIAGAARLAGQMKMAQGAEKLARLMRHPEPDVRVAAIEAAAALESETAAAGLVEALGDPDREVRILAARTVGALRY
ncbi:MAG: hypothetical protein D6701_03490, partial [Gemmatimonadetes bacterium]